MPVYDYECSSCGHKFTLVVPMKEHESSPKCPKCGETETEQTWDTGRAPQWSFKQ